MARPRKTGLDYFPLDTDFFSDEKVVCISGEFGLKGELAIIKLLCAIYRNGYFIEWNEVVRFKMVKTMPGVSAELIEQIVNRLVKWGFFDKALFDSAKVLTSRGIQRRYFDATRKRYTDGNLPYIISPSAYNRNNRLVTTMNNPAPAAPAPKKDAEQRTAKTPTFAPAKPPISLKDSVPQMKGDTIWGESVCMTYGISGLDALSALLDKFARHCTNKGQTTHDDIVDAKCHFVYCYEHGLLTREKPKQKTTDAPADNEPRKFTDEDADFGAADY